MGPMIDKPELRTQRLHLRPMTIDDVDRIALFISDYEVSKWLARVPHPYEHEHAIDWVARNAKPKPADETGFVLDRGEGLIGGIGFRLDEDTPDLGYWLAKPHWGKGLMSEAVEAVIGWLFEVTDHDQIGSGVFESNDVSLRIMTKLGFEITGRRNVHCLAQGKDLPHIDTLLKRNQFRSLAT